MDLSLPLDLLIQLALSYPLVQLDPLDRLSLWGLLLLLDRWDQLLLLPLLDRLSL